MIFAAVLLSAAAPTASTATPSPACYDVAKGQPHALTGKLHYVIFAGPPEFTDVRRGDTPEPGFVLDLARPICISGDAFADPGTRFSSVQLVETPRTAGRLKHYIDSSVTVQLTQQMAAETGHHHRPLVAWVTSVSPVARPMAFTDEYGTPATTIRAFYAALEDGQGADAAAMLVPEKRSLPAFSPAALTVFYGHLRTPIRLIDIAQAGADRFIVHYRYATVARPCDGRAEVRTITRRGDNFIAGIRALDGC